MSKFKVGDVVKRKNGKNFGDGVEHNLGVFETEIAAGLAYKQASRLLQGEYSID